MPDIEYENQNVVRQIPFSAKTNNLLSTTRINWNITPDIVFGDERWQFCWANSFSSAEQIVYLLSKTNIIGSTFVILSDVARQIPFSATQIIFSALMEYT